MVQLAPAALDLSKNQQVCVCRVPVKDGTKNTTDVLVFPLKDEIDPEKHPECVCIHTKDLSHHMFASKDDSVITPKMAVIRPSEKKPVVLRPTLLYGINMTFLFLVVMFLPCLITLLYVLCHRCGGSRSCS
jgi:hypothetical protein